MSVSLTELKVRTWPIVLKNSVFRSDTLKSEIFWHAQ
jgi:hypothetical protein